MKQIPEIPRLVHWLSQWAVSFSDGKQIIFLKKEEGVKFSSFFLFHSVFPFQFVEGLCPLIIVWSFGKEER